MKHVAWRNKREPKLVRSEPPHPDYVHLWDPLVLAADERDASAKRIAELESLITLPQAEAQRIISSIYAATQCLSCASSEQAHTRDSLIDAIKVLADAVAAVARASK